MVKFMNRRKLLLLFGVAPLAAFPVPKYTYASGGFISKGTVGKLFVGERPSEAFVSEAVFKKIKGIGSFEFSGVQTIHFVKGTITPARDETFIELEPDEYLPESIRLDD